MFRSVIKLSVNQKTPELAYTRTNTQGRANGENGRPTRSTLDDLSKLVLHGLVAIILGAHTLRH